MILPTLTGVNKIKKEKMSEPSKEITSEDLEVIADAPLEETIADSVTDELTSNASPEFVKEILAEINEKEPKTEDAPASLKRVKGTRINKMVLHGFKSFASRTELLFGENFNVVLGPNGSGKSNIIDAVCFVLGKSSSKSLRAEKASNLIYNGGKEKKSAKYGEVSIYFDNTDKTFPMDEDEIKVTRIVRDDGQSKYKINDSTRTRTEVLDLLSIAKINPDGYNIILQGDIVRFVSMSPLERRQIIEEISGISLYEEKKEKALRELDRVEDRLKEAEIVLKEREARLFELKKDRDQALRYKELNDRVNINKASYLHRQIQKKEAEKANYDVLMLEQTEKIQKAQVEIAGLRAEIQQKQDEIKQITKQIEEQSEDSQINLNREIEELKTHLIQNKTRSETCSAELSKLDSKKHQLSDDLTDLNKKISNLNDENERLSKQRESSQKEHLQMEKKIAEFKKKNDMASLGNIEQEVEELDTKADEKQKEISVLRESQQNLIRDSDKLRFQIEAIDGQIAKIAGVEAENKGQVASLKQKRDEFKKSTLELNKMINQDSAFAAQINSARRKSFSLDEELVKLNIKNAGFKEKIASDKALSMVLANKKDLVGVHGAVSELGNAESEYSIALEIAAGKKMKSVVVDDDTSAERCIDYLRQNKYGRAAFIPLNKIRVSSDNPDIKEILKVPGVIDLARNLVSYDLSYRKVFQFIFGDTIVVKDIVTARKIGIGKIRMVTIQGDLCETSAIMIGGYVDKQSRGVGFQEKEMFTKIKVLEDELAEQRELTAKFEHDRIENEEKIQKLREFKSVLEGEIITLERSLHIDSSELDASQSKKTMLSNDLSEMEHRMDDLQVKVSSMNKDLAAVKMKKHELRQKIAEIRSPALLAELTTFEQTRKELIELLLRLDSDLKNNELRITSMFEPERQKIQKLQLTVEKEIESFKKEIEEISVKIKESEKLLKQRQKQAEEFYARFREAFNKRAKISDDIQAIDRQIFEKDDKVRKTEQKLNKASVEFAEIRAVLTQMYEQFEKFSGVSLDNEKSETKLKSEIDEFERMIANLGMVNLRALEVYDEVEREHKSLVDKKDKLKAEKDDVVLMINEIETKKKDLFLGTFGKINENFNAIFNSLSTKGEAYLELEEPDQPFVGGVRIKVKLTGTKFMDITALSGGEKTMTSLALIFAIQEHEPASFYVMDEVDAALDKSNSRKLAELLKKYSEKAQYIVISHNDGVISQAHTLYGITMNEHGQSKAVSMKF